MSECKKCFESYTVGTACEPPHHGLCWPCSSEEVTHLREQIREYEKREYKCRGALSTAINELEMAVQDKWDGGAYVKNVRDGIIKAHDDLCVGS